MNHPAIDSTFQMTIHSIFGIQKGQAWLNLLPATLKRCYQKWGLKQGQAVQELSINYVEYTETLSGHPVVLKLGVPHPELYTEMAALTQFDGAGTVQIIDFDIELGALLLERLSPGKMLKDLDDTVEEARIAAALIKRIVKPVPNKITSVKPVPPKTVSSKKGVPVEYPQFTDWTGRAFQRQLSEKGNPDLMPPLVVRTACAAMKEIVFRCPEKILLHGDLHHCNILFDDSKGWTIIDPKGVLGPACLETGRFLHNQLPHSDDHWRCVQIIHQRIAVFETVLGIPADLIALSCLVDWVLSLCWSLEEDAPNSALGDEVVCLVQFAKSIAG